jgi:hypothetical protein
MADRHEIDEERAERGGRRALPVFTGKAASFPIWKARVRAWLSAETPPLLYVIETPDGTTDGGAAGGNDAAGLSAASSAPPSSSSKKKRGEQQLERDRLKVYNALITSLDDTHVGMIVTEVSEGDALGAWRILLRKYERNTAASRNQLRRELHTLKLGANESVDEYKARALHTVARLRASKEHVSDGEILYCLLEGLPPEYAMVRQALEVQDVVDVEVAFVHLREVEDKLRRERVGSAMSRGESSTSGETRLNNMSSDGRTRHPSRARSLCMVCGRDGHMAFRCWKRSPQGCYRCGGEHEVRDCDQDLVETSDSESESRGRRLERRGRPQTPVPGLRG